MPLIWGMNGDPRRAAHAGVISTDTGLTRNMEQSHVTG